MSPFIGYRTFLLPRRFRLVKVLLEEIEIEKIVSSIIKIEKLVEMFKIETLLLVAYYRDSMVSWTILGLRSLLLG